MYSKPGAGTEQRCSDLQLDVDTAVSSRIMGGTLAKFAERHMQQVQGGENIVDQWQYWKKGLIHPHSFFRRFWDMFTTYFVIYTALVLPYQLGFSQPATGVLLWKERLMDMTFIADFCFNFITCYEVKGRMEERRLKIAKHYAAGWMWIDLASTFPMDYIYLGNSAQSEEQAPQCPPNASRILDTLASDTSQTEARSLKLVRITRIMKIVRLLRLLRTSKIGRMIAKYEVEIDVSHNVIVMLRFVIGVIVVSHWLGCFWFMIPTLMEFPADSWVQSMTSGTGMDADGNALPLADQCVSKHTQYIVCFYWAVTTMSTIGYGDISPTNDEERIFASFCMILGSGIFAFGMSTMCDIVAHLNLRDCAFRETMNELDEYMNYRDCPRDLKLRIRRHMYFMKSSDTGSFFRVKSILGHLAPNLRAEFDLFTYAKLFASCSLFHNPGTVARQPKSLSQVGSEIMFGGNPPDPRSTPLPGSTLQCQQFLQAMVPVLKGRVFAPEERLILQNSYSSALFFIVDGTVRSYFLSGSVQGYHTGDFFGHTELLHRSHLEYITATMCDIFWIPRREVLDHLRLAPEIYQRMLELTRRECIKRTFVWFAYKAIFHTWVARHRAHTHHAASSTKEGATRESDGNETRNPRNASSISLKKRLRAGTVVATTIAYQSSVLAQHEQRFLRNQKLEKELHKNAVKKPGMLKVEASPTEETLHDAVSRLQEDVKFQSKLLAEVVDFTRNFKPESKG